MRTKAHELSQSNIVNVLIYYNWMLTGTLRNSVYDLLLVFIRFNVISFLCEGGSLCIEETTMFVDYLD